MSRGGFFAIFTKTLKYRTKIYRLPKCHKNIKFLDVYTYFLCLDTFDTQIEIGNNKN